MIAHCERLLRMYCDDSLIGMRSRRRVLRWLPVVALALFAAVCLATSHWRAP